MTVIDAQRLAPSRTTVEDFGPALIAVCVILVIAATSVPSFYGGSNLNGIAPQLAALATLSIGQMLVLLVRGIDLSVSAVIGVTGVVFATGSFGSDLERLAIVTLVAAATGLTNGLLVTKRGVPRSLPRSERSCFSEGSGSRTPKDRRAAQLRTG